MILTEFGLGVLQNATWSAIAAGGRRFLGRMVNIGRGKHRPAAGRETDRAAFADLVQMMTTSRTADFLRRTCFGSESFHWRQLNEIENYVTFSDGAECEFIDRDLEALRRKFIAEYKIFRPLLAQHTAPTPWTPTYRTVQVEWRETNPERYARTVDTLRAAADKVCAAYDELIRTARERLAP
jgi:hypothetical protein